MAPPSRRRFFTLLVAGTLALATRPAHAAVAAQSRELRFSHLHTGEVHNYWAADHAHNAALGFPLLVLDMYEHAYQMDYGAAAAKYVDAFMTNVNWEEVNKRVEMCSKM